MNTMVNSVFKEYQSNPSTNATVGRQAYPSAPIPLSIRYHEPQGEGDAHYCEIVFDNGEVLRVFRPDEIGMKAEVTTSE